MNSFCVRSVLCCVVLLGVKTSGYWKILTKKIEDDFDEHALVAIEKQNSFEMQVFKEDGNESGRQKEEGGLEFHFTKKEIKHQEPKEDTGPIQRDTDELNAILSFLQNNELYLSEQDKEKIKFVASDLKKMKQPIIRIIIEGNNDEVDEDEEKENERDRNNYVEEEGIYDDVARKNSKSRSKIGAPGAKEKWYDIYWWNSCREDNKVHSLALKNYLSKGKMEYYIRYVMGQTPKKQTSKSGLNSMKHSRSNTRTNHIDSQNTMDHNYTNKAPNEQILEWIWFNNDTASYERYELGNNVLKQLEASFHSNCSDVFPKSLNCNFNYLLLKEMTARMKNRGKNVGLGYGLRFAYSNSDRGKIVNMEQLSIFKTAPTFSRSVQRMINGRNRYFNCFFFLQFLLCYF